MSKKPILDMRAFKPTYVDLRVFDHSDPDFVVIEYYLLVPSRNEQMVRTQATHRLPRAVWEEIKAKVKDDGI